MYILNIVTSFVSAQDWTIAQCLGNDLELLPLRKANPKEKIGQYVKYMWSNEFYYFMLFGKTLI